MIKRRSRIAGAILALTLTVGVIGVGAAGANSFTHNGNCNMSGSNFYIGSGSWVGGGSQNSTNCTDVRIGLRVRQSGVWSTKWKTEYDRSVSHSVGGVDTMDYSKHDARFNGVWGGLTLNCC